MAAEAGAQRLGDTALPALRSALQGDGLWLDVGLAVLRVRSDSPYLPPQLQAVYRHFPLADRPAWADLHVDLMRPRGPRRWWHPQVQFQCDAQVPFEPFPADSPLPLLEWSANWLMGRRCNHRLLLHAGVVERQGCALLMPALPGSGKSTLTAALSLRGWRLLSDEFGVLDTDALLFQAALKPVALKNTSIDIIRAFAPGAELGPSFPKTRKGTVAHLAPPREAVDRRHEAAAPGSVILPRWQAGEATRFEQVHPQVAFTALAFNAFNYTVQGADGFRAVAALVRACPIWQLVYSDLDDALAELDRRWPDVVAGHAARLAAARNTAQPLAVGQET